MNCKQLGFIFFILIISFSFNMLGMLKVIKYPEAAKPHTNLTIEELATQNNTKYEPDSKEKLFNKGMALLRASYKLSDPGDVKQQNRVNGINILADLLNDYKDCRAFAILYFIFETRDIPCNKYAYATKTLKSIVNDIMKYANQHNGNKDQLRLLIMQIDFLKRVGKEY